MRWPDAIVLMTASAIGLFFHEYLADVRLGVDPVAALAEPQTVAVTTIILFQAIYVGLPIIAMEKRLWRWRARPRTMQATGGQLATAHRQVDED